MAYTYKPYEESEAVKQAKANLEAQVAKKPTEYTSNWQTQLNETLNQIQNRKPFTYDLNADALYQQYKDMYTTQGQMAMMDTMGQAAALTGGYGSSYGQNVGQQAYNAHLQNLNNKVPELYQLALSKYNQEGDDLYRMYALAGEQEAMDYGKYRDALGDWQAERDFLIGQYNAERDYDYGRHTADQNFQYQLDRDAAADAQWQAQFDEAIRQYNQDYAFNERKYNDAQAASAGSGGGGGGYDPAIAAEQMYLNSLGANLEVDGIDGPLTQAAREKYQNGGNTNPPVKYSDAKRTISTLFGTGSSEKAVNHILSMWNQFTKEQKEEMKSLARTHGYEIEED